MSGQDVPYYLRPNKHVERQIFLDILSHINRWTNLKEYLYASMGGKHLEDLKAVYSALGVKNLLSIECNHVTYERQMFNRPFSFLDCLKTTTGEFIAQLDKILEEKKANNCIVWLDYASAKNRQGQLQEVETIASKLAKNDILKITLNASRKTLGADKEDNESEDDFQRRLLEKAKAKLGAYFPGHIPDHSRMTDSGFAEIVSHASKAAILKGLAGSPNLSFLPLGQFRYNDGYHWMYTMTGIFLDREKEEEFRERSGIEDSDFISTDWQLITEIALPDLSLRERMEIDLNIHLRPDEIHAKLPFGFDSNPERSVDTLKRYIKHYKRYPNFVRAVF
ncbi:MAG: hypothetical protein KGZ69_05425 [Methylomonas sp.]|nr:hypothetical protein [Methylomonas sp.]